MAYTLKTKNLWYKGKLTCKLCKKTYQHLGSHIAKGHKITAREYKEEFGLPYQEALISEDIYHKKVKKFREEPEKYLKNLRLGGIKHQFKKGQTGQRRISAKERERSIERIKKVNKQNLKLESCPVCNIKFINVRNHLYSKHKLLQI